VRYGLQLYGEVRKTDEAKKAKDFVTLQKAQNKMLRILCKVSIKDKISIESILSKQNMLSINQLYARIKLIEMWKAANCEKYPLDINKPSSCHHGDKK
jgi:hypothetical protein